LNDVPSSPLLSAPLFDACFVSDGAGCAPRTYRYCHSVPCKEWGFNLPLRKGTVTPRPPAARQLRLCSVA
jgi:hypothetical protein